MERLKIRTFRKKGEGYKTRGRRGGGGEEGKKRRGRRRGEEEEGERKGKERKGKRQCSLDRGHSYTAFLIVCRTLQPLCVWAGREGLFLVDHTCKFIGILVYPTPLPPPSPRFLPPPPPSTDLYCFGSLWCTTVASSSRRE